MTAHSDHEVYLRAELRAAADSLQLRGDGLELIRARMRQPRSAAARLHALYAEIAMRTPAPQDLVYQVAEWLRLAQGWLRLAYERFAPADWLRLAYERFAPAQAGRHRSRTQGLLRPLAAMAVVMFIVAAGTYVAISASTAIFPSSSSNSPSGGGGPAGHSHSAAPGPSHTSGTQGIAGTGNPAPGTSCKSASPKPSKSPAVAPPPASPSVSPTPAPTDSTTDTSPPAADPSASAAPSAVPSAPPSPNTSNPPANSPGPKPSPSC